MVSSRRNVIERTHCQLTVREEVDGVEFEEAVPLAVKALFRFSHRAKGAKALWSRAHSVWLGRSTFMHWSIKDENIDIPWCVARTKNAPRNKEKLSERVQAELVTHFADRLSKLPRRSPGSWLPLP